MFASKILPLTLVAKTGLRRGFKNFSTSVVRNEEHGEWTYRGKQRAPKFNLNFATCCGVFAWWWVSWHVFSDYGHVVGHFDFVDAKTWTDEELGIPPDDAEDP
ncbi:unnamed protein product [Allacma fusca]|uniref:NADH dehydrogenase [ubiquinone] 1 beta subcomplex subunit 2, mitochondrial n=1 Tax=Allacma fusca TaxID=39272 RepID=A0A8J2KQR1_9HEXA|nr:unnamed protein product [Allacma fusca]